MDFEEILSSRNFDEIKIVDDETGSFDVAKEIIKNKNDEEPFYVFDVGEIIQKYETMVSLMPRVMPFYAIKCNPHSTIVKFMTTLNAGFDCASKREIQVALASGVPAERIIYANTYKPDSHIRLAKDVGVDMLTVDSEAELYKIKHIFPEAKVVIRFRCDANVGIILGVKFGCDADTVAPELLVLARDLGLNVYGFSFNAGSQCIDAEVYGRGIRIAARLIRYAKSLGFEEVQLLDIGGGFPSPDACPIEKFAEVVNEALEEVEPWIKVISEPGRYFVSSPFTLATFITGKKTINEGDGTRFVYKVNDGVFGSFLNSALSITNRLTPIPMSTSSAGEAQSTTILGSTSLAKDCIVGDCLLPELNIGKKIRFLVGGYNENYQLGMNAGFCGGC